MSWGADDSSKVDPWESNEGMESGGYDVNRLPDALEF